MDDPPLHIVLYQPEIPYNAGAVGRTCVAIGAKLWLIRPLGFEINDRRLRRAGLDYWRHLEWEVVDDWQGLTKELPADRAWYFSKRAERLYTEADYRRGDILVFGCETRGLPAEMLRANWDRCLRVPIRPKARSLNLSVSVGIIAYEACRKLDSLPKGE
jgi:tRNA (cytidine/uridine-2'-O-)-methyltransferase